MRGGLVHHIIKIPAALSLLLLRGTAVGRAPTIFQNDWFCTRISNFFESPIFSIAMNKRERRYNKKKKEDTIYLFFDFKKKIALIKRRERRHN